MTVLTGAMNLVPQDSNLLEMSVQGLRNRKSLHLVYKGDYPNLQLASIALHNKQRGYISMMVLHLFGNMKSASTFMPEPKLNLDTTDVTKHNQLT